MSNHRWYVLQVRTGEEARIAEELNRRGYTAAVPIENRVIRRGGKWTQQPYVVFSGYVFVYLDYSWAKYYAMSGIHGVLRLLGGGQSPTPLSRSEAVFIRRLSVWLSKPSVVTFSENGDWRCVSGFLAEHQDKIVKIEKRYKRAAVLVTVAGEEKQIKVSFTEAAQTPVQTEDRSVSAR